MKKVVNVDGRRFTVHYKDGAPHRITERKLWAEGTYHEAFYNAPYWHANHHKVGAAWTLTARVLAKASEVA